MTSKAEDFGFRISDFDRPINDKTTVSSFIDLTAWKISHQLVINLYKLTKDFPKEEIYGLTSQMRRAAVSVTSNIAEGFSRFNSKEKVQFYRISAGSITELQSQILIARDLNYLSDSDSNVLLELISRSHKLVNGLIRSTTSKNPVLRNPKSEIRNSENNKESILKEKEPSDE